MSTPPVSAAQTFRITTLCIAHLCIGFRTHYSPDHPQPAPSFVAAAAIVSVSFVFVCALVILVFFILETFRRTASAYFSISSLDFQNHFSSTNQVGDTILQFYSELTSICPLQLISKCKTNTNHNDHNSSMACAVCLDDLSSNEIGRLLPCGHYFHASCIDRWILHMATRSNARQINALCPLCKRSLFEHPTKQNNKSSQLVEHNTEETQISSEISELV